MYNSENCRGLIEKNDIFYNYKRPIITPKVITFHNKI